MAKRKVFESYDPTPPGPSVADLLRETRQGMGYELRDVAAMLRIRYPYLQAIEDGRYNELPGSAYAAGFVRSYAEYLGLDSEAVVTRYKEEAVGAARRQELYLPTPVPEGRMPGGTILLGTLVLAGLVYGGWYYLSATDRSMVDLVPALPDRLVSLIDGLSTRGSGQPGSPDATAPAGTQSAEAPILPTSPATQTPPTIVPPPLPATPPAAAQSPTPAPQASVPVMPPPPVPTAKPSPASTPVPSPAAAATPAAPPASAPAASTPTAPALATPPVQTAAQTPAVPPALTNVPPPPAEEEEEATQEPTPLTPGANPPAAPARAPEPAAGTGKVYGTLNQNARLVLRATQDSWLQIKDGSEIVFTRVLKPGDTYRVPDKPGVKIRTGNAGGLVVVADGVESPPLGSVGQVLRDVGIDAHGVVRGAAR